MKVLAVTTDPTQVHRIPPHLIKTGAFEGAQEGPVDTLAYGSRYVVARWPEKTRVVLAMKGLEQSAYDRWADARRSNFCYTRN
jgi:hypothetical protein